MPSDGAKFHRISATLCPCGAKKHQTDYKVWAVRVYSYTHTRSVPAGTGRVRVRSYG